MNGFTESEWTRRPNGEFLEHARTAPEVTLDSIARPSHAIQDRLASRRENLRQLGFAPAVAADVGNPYRNVAPGSWWVNTAALAERQPVGYPKMQIANDGRRSYLKRYGGSETALRMPSAASIRRYADMNGDTFDVPVEAATPNGPVTGYVRVTRNGPGRWSVSGVGMTDPKAGYVAESVSAVLEARRVTRALPETRNILARRRERLAAAGVNVRALRDSTWLQAGYNDNDEQMVVTLNGRPYGYKVDRDTYEQVAGATSPGRAYNQLVKNKAPRYQIDQCGKCGSYFQVARLHRCRSQHGAPQTLSQQNAYLTRELVTV